MPETISVVVDRPFLFVIHDVEHGTPLFVGRVTRPARLTLPRFVCGLSGWLPAQRRRRIVVGAVGGVA